MQPVKYYLRSPDGSRTGSLDIRPPGDEPPTRYAYDPRDPVPSIGGNANHRGQNKTLRTGAVLREGSFDQRPVEDRQDVLVFSTATLDEDVELIGPVTTETVRSHRRARHRLHSGLDRRAARRCRDERDRRHHPGEVPRVDLGIAQVARARRGLRIHAGTACRRPACSAKVTRSACTYPAAGSRCGTATPTPEMTRPPTRKPKSPSKRFTTMRRTRRTSCCLSPQQEGIADDETRQPSMVVCSVCCSSRLPFNDTNRRGGRTAVSDAAR